MLTSEPREEHSHEGAAVALSSISDSLARRLGKVTQAVTPARTLVPLKAEKCGCIEGVGRSTLLGVSDRYICVDAHGANVTPPLHRTSAHFPFSCEINFRS